jgi:hypothetical protein
MFFLKFLLDDGKIRTTDPDPGGPNNIRIRNTVSVEDFKALAKGFTRRIHKKLTYLSKFFNIFSFLNQDLGLTPDFFFY